jgi:GntR family transcriptional regulator, transcriptional repressor for pyruvate dehydrogenase complex
MEPKRTATVSAPSRAASDAGERQPFFPEIQRRAVATEAISTLKQMIIRGELTAGQRLPSERELALLLGVSRPSLREAIRALIAMNVLESRQGDGTYVTSLEPELLAEPIDFLLQVSHAGLISLLEARRAIEAEVVQLAAKRATDLELRELERFADSGRGKLDDVDAFIDYDAEFHERIRVMARSPILGSLMSTIRELVREMRRRISSPALRRSVLADHRAIARALSKRDAERASAAMIKHLERLLDVLGEEAATAPARSSRRGRTPQVK